MRSNSIYWAGGLLVLFVVCLLGYRWQQNELRRQCLAALVDFRTALNSPDSARLLAKIAIPAAIRGRTVQEQSEFVRKALRDEISEDGLRLIAQRGTFGPLAKIFPLEGPGWAQQAGVDLDNCSAFKFEDRGLRSEVVLEAYGNAYRIVRCNNVKQLAKGP